VPITEKTRKADEKLREKLKHVDLETLKKAVRPLLNSNIGKPKKPIKPNGD
jgi:hypothetical protein